MAGYNPTLLTMPIAENGTKNPIPATTTATGKMSQNAGFPPECSLPLGAGGVAPDRADFNGAFNLMSTLEFYTQKGFSYYYDDTQDYLKGCCVIDPTDERRYECTVDMTAGTIAPSADTTQTHWRPYALINSDGEAFYIGLDGNWVPSSAIYIYSANWEIGADGNLCPKPATP